MVDAARNSRKPIDWTACGVRMADVALTAFTTFPGPDDLRLCDATPDILLAALIRGRNVDRTAALWHRNLTTAVLVTFCAATDELTDVGRDAQRDHPDPLSDPRGDSSPVHALGHTLMPGWVFPLLADHRNPWWRAAAVTAERTPTEVSVRLANDGDPIVQDRVADHGQLALIRRPIHELAAHTRRRIADRKDRVPARILLQLARDDRADIRRAIANRGSLPITVARVLAVDDDQLVRVTLAQRVSHSEIRERLSHDQDGSVRYHAAGSRRSRRHGF